MPNILCIETATEVCSVALSSEGTVLSEKTLTDGRRHSSMLTTLIDECLDLAGISFPQLDAVAVTDGPGSYTGLRVGASTAKGLCYSLGIPLIAIPSLQSLAWRHRSSSGPSILPMIDARRMEVYTAIYHSDLSLAKDTFNLILTKEALIDLQLKYGPLVVCGNGAIKCHKQFGDLEGFQFFPDACSARLMTGLASQAYHSESFEDLAYYRPFYYKQPNITKGKTYFSGLKEL